MKNFRTIRSLFNSKNKQAVVENEFSGSIRIATSVLKNSSGTCHCGGMTIPMEVIGNTYKCVRCAEQSINIRPLAKVAEYFTITNTSITG